MHSTFCYPLFALHNPVIGCDTHTHTHPNNVCVYALYVPLCVLLSIHTHTQKLVHVDTETSATAHTHTQNASHEYAIVDALREHWPKPAICTATAVTACVEWLGWPDGPDDDHDHDHDSVATNNSQRRFLCMRPVFGFEWGHKQRVRPWTSCFFLEGFMCVFLLVVICTVMHIGSGRRRPGCDDASNMHKPPT